MMEGNASRLLIQRIDNLGAENQRLTGALAAVTAERDRLAEKVEKVRSRCVTVYDPKDAVIPNALDAWGRPVKQFLPYDFSGNPGASATQYCNGWNDAGGYWKAYCVDLQGEVEGLRGLIRKSLDYFTESGLPDDLAAEYRVALAAKEA